MRSNSTAVLHNTVTSLLWWSVHVRELLEPDTSFYCAIDAVTALVSVVGLVALAMISPGGVGARELVGHVVGFFCS